MWCIQAKSLNVRRDRCVEDVEYTTELCELECFSEQLVRHAGCLLPFMKLSHTSPYKRNRSICNPTAPIYRATVEQMKLMLTGDETIWVNTLHLIFFFFFRTLIVCFKMNYNRSPNFLFWYRTVPDAIASRRASKLITKRIKKRWWPIQNRTDFVFEFSFRLFNYSVMFWFRLKALRIRSDHFPLHLFHAVYTYVVKTYIKWSIVAYRIGIKCIIRVRAQ